MKKVILAAVATAALCVPALAQQSGQTQSQPGSASSQVQNASGGQNMSAHGLNANQVQEIQQALDEKGFKSGKVDGKWGPQTEVALKDFQKSQNMSSTGDLNGATIAGLGLNSADFGVSSKKPETTGQGPSGSNANQNASQHNGAMNQNAPHNGGENNQNTK
jgi:peptidoglycan hydrolase-like protein with peptidoglycan-binding domain